MSPGPPPRRPAEPLYYRTTHVLHLLLTLVSFGLWAIVWLILASSNDRKTARLRREYREACARFDYDYWVWAQATRDYEHWRRTGEVPRFG